MKCRTCGATMEHVQTDLPFKISEKTIVVVKDLPVLQCGSCAEYHIQDDVFRRVEELLSTVDRATELEIIRFAA